MSDHTNFDIASYIQKRYINAVADTVTYLNWDPAFALKEIRDLPDRIRKAEGFRLIDLNDLTPSQLKTLGFSAWDDEPDENNNVLMLIPSWIVPYVDPTTPVVSISGNACTLAEADRDTRFGCLAYGIHIKQPPAPGIENRYFVCKYTDIVAADLSVDQLVALANIGHDVEESRKQRGKAPLKTVVVESDWTNYESVLAEVLAHDAHAS